MSYHRQEVEDFLDRTGIIETEVEIDKEGEAEINFSYKDAINPNDNIITSGQATIEYIETGYIDSSTLDIINQDPEFFMTVLQAKYDIDGDGEQVDFENEYDNAFMESLADIIQEQSSIEIKQKIDNTKSFNEPVASFVREDLEEQLGSKPKKEKKKALSLSM